MPTLRFTVATMNLYNLNLPGLPLYTNAAGWSEEGYARKVAWSASQLRLLRPDVVGLQELWHAEAGRAVLAASGLAESHTLLVGPDADGTHIVCAALVRTDLLEGEPSWIADFPDAFRLASSGEDPQTPAIDINIRGFSRPVLRFAIRPRAREAAVEVLVAHLKSKAPTRIDAEDWYRAQRDTHAPHATAIGAALSTIRRTAEAAALRWHLTGIMRGTDTPVIVMGDLNDGHNSNTLNVITGQPRFLVGDSLGGGDTALYTCQTLQEYRDSRDVYYTYIHQDLRESLDHILVSEQFYENSRRRLWLFDGLTITNDHLNVDDHRDSGTSDHGIVAAAFRWAPAPTPVRAG